jgi:hypothetical protein
MEQVLLIQEIYSFFCRNFNGMNRYRQKMTVGLALETGIGVIRLLRIL